MTQPYDVIIIGTGAGGGPLALRLAQAGKRLLILERGPFLPQEKNNWDTTSVFLDDRYHTSEVWQRADGKALHPGTGYWVGGNTKVYGAAMFRLRKQDFEVLQHQGGVSPEWPVKYDTFEPYYTQAEKLFEVHGKAGLDPSEPPRSGDFLFPPVTNEPKMQEIENELKKLGLNPFPTPLALKLNEQNPVDSRCIRCDTCDAYPCLVHAKADADINCIRKIMHFPNVTLITNAKVTRLLTNSSGTEVSGVEVELTSNKKDLVNNPAKTEIFKGNLVALCCGAINSAALLLRSATSACSTGLANSSDMVGRNYMFHQSDTLLAIGLKKVRGRYLKTVSVNDFYFGSKDYPFPMGNVQPLGSVHAEMMRADAPFFVPKIVLKLMAERAVPWWLMTEDLPDPNNRISLSNGTIQINYQKNNTESFERLIKTWVHVLKQTGQGNAWYRLSAYFKKNVDLQGVGHQNGTCRFGTDPKTSVLDINCRSHDVGNLYVVDSSFFPSCGAVNPSLTVVANSLRVADHLLQRMR